MSPFLKAAEARALAMREEMLATTPAKQMKGDQLGSSLTFAEKMEARRHEEAERENRIRRAVAMRAQGFTWEEIGEELNLTRRVRDALARAVKRRTTKEKS